MVAMVLSLGPPKYHAVRSQNQHAAAEAVAAGGRVGDAPTVAQLRRIQIPDATCCIIIEFLNAPTLRATLPENHGFGAFNGFCGFQ
jgi:hypothetical protein